MSTDDVDVQGEDHCDLAASVEEVGPVERELLEPEAEAEQDLAEVQSPTARGVKQCEDPLADAPELALHQARKSSRWLSHVEVAAAVVDLVRDALHERTAEESQV